MGFSLYVSPSTFIGDIDFSTPGTKYLTNMWAARQIAIAAIIGYSLWRRSVSMLKISLIAYCLMNFQDILIGVSRGDAGLIIGASVFFALPALMIFVLSQGEKIK